MLVRAMVMLATEAMKGVANARFWVAPHLVLAPSSLLVVVTWSGLPVLPVLFSFPFSYSFCSSY